jgi:hypothetical protein
MNGPYETLAVAHLERGRGRARVDAGKPECLGRVDVADTSDNALIEERELDRDTPGGERPLEMPRVERGIDRVRTKDGGQRASSIEQLHSGERARIGEDDSAAIVELQDESREARKLGIDPLHHPVAGHAKVHVQCRSVVEDGKLVLSTAIDARDGATYESPQLSPPKPASDVRVRHGRAHDARA